MRCWLIFLLTFWLPALHAAAPFTRQPAGKATVAWRTDAPPAGDMPLWLHLHGNHDTVEQAFASLDVPGVLVTLTLPGLSKVYADHFAEPAAFATLMAEVIATVRNAHPNVSWEPGALTVSSFSAGFGGVRQLLRQPAAFDRIGTLVMADSIYCGYTGPAAERRVDPALMEGFVRFARLASEGKKRMLVTHSAQVPDGYASTTETADTLIAATGGTRVADEVRWGDGLLQASRCTRGGFEVLGFTGAEAKDHLQHLRSLGPLLQRARQSAPPP
jgi:hypothetical protein